MRATPLRATTTDATVRYVVRDLTDDVLSPPITLFDFEVGADFDETEARRTAVAALAALRASNPEVTTFRAFRESTSIVRTIEEIQ